MRKYAGSSLILSALALISPRFVHASAGAALHVAGGIAMPAASTAVFTNPAGMVGPGSRLVLQAGTPEVWNHGTYRAGAQTGGSAYGVAAGIEGQDRTGDDALRAYYGLAVGVPTFSLGIGGRTGISNASGSAFNLGALFTPTSLARFGVTVRGIGDGVHEWGGGAGIGILPGVDFVVDAAADENFGHPELKPGVKIGAEVAALTFSYGTGARQQFADGFTAGGSFSFASANTLEIQYNAGGSLSKYFACFTRQF